MPTKFVSGVPKSVYVEGHPESDSGRHTLICSQNNKGSLPRARPFGTPGTSFIGVNMRAIGMHMHIIGVHMHIIGVHTRANKICVRRAKARACGRPA